MKAPLLLALLALLVPIGTPTARLQLDVRQGRVFVAPPPGAGKDAPPITRRAGEEPYDLERSTHLTAPALSDFGLRWLGLASVQVKGTADLWVEAGPGLVLERFTSAELEVRRGPLSVEVVGRCSFEVSSAALGLQALPDGGIELIHRGGQPIAVRPAGTPHARRLRGGERLRF